jgi:hypothetical protein
LTEFYNKRFQTLLKEEGSGVRSTLFTGVIHKKVGPFNCGFRNADCGI